MAVLLAVARRVPVRPPARHARRAARPDPARPRGRRRGARRPDRRSAERRSPASATRRASPRCRGRDGTCSTPRAAVGRSRCSRPTSSSGRAAGTIVVERPPRPGSTRGGCGCSPRPSGSAWSSSEPRSRTATRRSPPWSRSSLIGGPVALLLASLAGYALAGATLRPVESMRRRAAEISDHVGGRRLPVPAGDDEVARLARTLNEMLAPARSGPRARAPLRRRGEPRAADAARARSRPSSSSRCGGPARPRSFAPRSPRPREETDRLAELAEDLLVLARSDEGELRIDPRPVPARELLETVAGRFAARAEEARPLAGGRGARGPLARFGDRAPSRAGARQPRRQRPALRRRARCGWRRSRERLGRAPGERRGAGLRRRVPPAGVRALQPSRRRAGPRSRRPRPGDRRRDRPRARRRPHPPAMRPAAALRSRFSCRPSAEAGRQRLHQLLLEPGEIGVDGRARARAGRRDRGRSSSPRSRRGVFRARAGGRSARAARSRPRRSRASCGSMVRLDRRREHGSRPTSSWLAVRRRYSSLGVLVPGAQAGSSRRRSGCARSLADRSRSSSQQHASTRGLHAPRREERRPQLAARTRYTL